MAVLPAPSLTKIYWRAARFSLLLFSICSKHEAVEQPGRLGPRQILKLQTNPICRAAAKGAAREADRFQERDGSGTKLRFERSGPGPFPAIATHRVPAVVALDGPKPAPV